MSGTRFYSTVRWTFIRHPPTQADILPHRHTVETRPKTHLGFGKPPGSYREGPGPWEGPGRAQGPGRAKNGDFEHKKPPGA